MSCITIPGAGANLQVRLITGGNPATTALGDANSQISPSAATPTLSYNTPSIVSITGAGATAGSTGGGDSVTIVGANFGPALLINNFVPARITGSYSDFLTAGLGVNNTQQTISVLATNCRVTVDHTTVTCITGPGAGTHLTWFVAIMGQQSLNPATSYGPPVIRTINYTGGTQGAFTSALPDGSDSITLHGGAPRCSQLLSFTYPCFLQ
jgi:hypothetical protein